MSTLIVVLFALAIIIGFLLNPALFLFVLGVVTWNPVILLIAIFIAVCR